MNTWHKCFMLGDGLLNKQFQKHCQNTSNKTAIRANFHFSPFTSLWKLSCHSNQSVYATTIKNVFVEANFKNIFAVAALSPIHYCIASELFVFCLFIFFAKLVLIAMTTNQIERFGQKVYVW